MMIKITFVVHKMDKPYSDIAYLLLRHMNITTKKNLALTNKYWWNLIKRVKLTCSNHYYHCKLCVSELNKTSSCMNMNCVYKCFRCDKTFCKHLRVKKCFKCKSIYDKNYKLCGICCICNC